VSPLLPVPVGDASMMSTGLPNLRVYFVVYRLNIMYYPMYEVLTDGSSDSMLNCIPRAVWLGGYQNRLT